ncbi:MAG TPA: hypothetical protein PLU54_08710 [Deltaproteobacteria bacterium]|nr:hypothetical protein [Deltaproteobacteria bacterium]
MKMRLVGMAAGVFLVAVMLTGCGSEGSDEDGADITPGTELAYFTDKVKACMPYLERSSPSTGTTDLKAWNGWNPRATSTVLGKLFDPGIGGDECLYTQLEILDSHIEMANAFADEWGTSGSYTKGGVTAVVDTSVTTVVIPYLGVDSPPVSRLITMTDSSQDLTVHMAFSFLTNPPGQTLVSQYVKGTESGVYYAWFEGDKVRIWHASVGDRKVQMWWEGNTAEYWFKISECTDAAGLNWEAMGGGSIDPVAGGMAIMARNNATNFSEDRYYLTLSLDELEDADEVDIIDGGEAPPSGTGVLAYITEGNSLCLGFLGVREYPDEVDDLAWEQ